MNLVCNPSTLSGTVEIPGSKSHTIRAVAIASLAEGESVIEAPLESHDARSARAAYEALGAQIEAAGDAWRVRGTSGALRPPGDVIDVGNSGTTLRLAMGSAALLREGAAVFTGDPQVRRRPSGPLAQALCELGARAWSTRRNGLPPYVIEGRLRGGETTVEAMTSQYVSSLLIAAPLAAGDTLIRTPVLHERPYVDMTIDWLASQGVEVERDGYAWFRVRGGHRYAAFQRRVPGDFSTATFFLAAGALPGNAVTCRGLDMNDTQGDRAVADYLREMGAQVEVTEAGIRVTGATLRGCELDLNATPDALPMMAALACYARGETRLVNVPQARVKETDRIAVMREELEKMGGDVEELEDGLVIRERPLRGVTVDGRDDHRVVMALAIAATAAEGSTRIRGAEAMAVTNPGFVEALESIGGLARAEEPATKEGAA